MVEKTDRYWDKKHDGYPIGVIGKDPSSPGNNAIILDHKLPRMVKQEIGKMILSGNILKIPDYWTESEKKVPIGKKVFAGKSKILKL